MTGRVSDNTCTCKEIGYFENGVATCGICDVQCKKCSSTTDGCTECSDLTTRKDTSFGCVCKDGFFEEGNILCGGCDV